MGAFDEFELFQPGATVSEFREGLDLLTQHGLWYVVTAKHSVSREIIPMCLIAGDYIRTEREDDVGSIRVRQVYEPHVVWFGWATARNRVECGVRFFNAIRREMCCMVYATPSERAYFTQLCRYGVMRRVGKVMDYFGFDREPADVWQTRRAKS